MGLSHDPGMSSIQLPTSQMTAVVVADVFSRRYGKEIPHLLRHEPVTPVGLDA